MKTTSSVGSVIAFLALGLFGSGGCATKNPFDSKPDGPPGPPPKIWGVEPSKFDCQSLVPTKDVSTLAGGEVTFEGSGVPTAEGTPSPCAWVLEHKPTEAEQKAMEKEQEKLAKKANDSGGAGSIEFAVAAWGKSKDKVYGVSFDCRDRAHARTDEWFASLAGNPDAKDVPGLGKRAMDHKGGQLVFNDANTPCSVTLNASDEVSRQALAKLVLARLTNETAPMRPRIAPKSAP